MCTYQVVATPISGSGYGFGDWIDVRKAVVSYDHPLAADGEHALCIDFRTDNGDPASRIAVELDAASARRLADAIMATLSSHEVRELL